MLVQIYETSCPEEAKALGVIDELVPEWHDLKASAIAMARRVADTKPLPRIRDRDEKLAEAKAKADVLAARHRRSRVVTSAADAQLLNGSPANAQTFERMENKVLKDEGYAHALTALANDDVENRLALLEKEDEVEKLLAELKSRKP